MIRYKTKRLPPSVWTYKGVVVFPVSGSVSGVRWCARMDNAPAMLRADTKASMRALCGTVHIRQLDRAETQLALNVPRLEQRQQRGAAVNRQERAMNDYWSKPYGVRIETSHFSGTFKFDTIGEAYQYLFEQFAVVEQIIRNREYGNSWVNFDCNRSWLETPDGRVQARYVLNVYDLSSSRGLIV